MKKILYFLSPQYFDCLHTGITGFHRPARTGNNSNRQSAPFPGQGIQPSALGRVRARPFSGPLVAVLSAFMLLAGATAMAKTGLALFGSQEIRSQSLRTFPKWTGMLARNTIKTGAKPAVCKQGIVKNCVPGRWLEIVEQLRNHDRSTQINMVNKFINGGDYALDSKNWGIDDYWATPSQFLARDGDCEDFAIAKYLTLKWLGMNAANMRIVVLQDRKRRTNHAVLAVYEENNIVILDNLINRPMPASAIHHYKPIFSINEEAWWLHMSKRSLDN